MLEREQQQCKQSKQNKKQYDSRRWKETKYERNKAEEKQQLDKKKTIQDSVVFR